MDLNVRHLKKQVLLILNLNTSNVIMDLILPRRRLNWTLTCDTSWYKLVLANSQVRFLHFTYKC